MESSPAGKRVDEFSTDRVKNPAWALQQNRKIIRKTALRLFTKKNFYPNTALFIMLKFFQGEGFGRSLLNSYEFLRFCVYAALLNLVSSGTIFCDRN